ncbi:hypothetical protein CIW50_24800 [Tardiphaga sp. P9-11]|nr:hypothetical protein CIW50_24800 [Tardiphaga sp. P9-11]
MLRSAEHVEVASGIYRHSAEISIATCAMSMCQLSTILTISFQSWKSNLMIQLLNASWNTTP